MKIGSQIGISSNFRYLLWSASALIRNSDACIGQKLHLSFWTFNARVWDRLIVMQKYLLHVCIDLSIYSYFLYAFIIINF